ncbi:right-handed parallel beta-helix repeat-containing protein [Salinibacter sp.]|uniref:right-handed parallel beta-helix repeat-containing protein n=1 Tax=Salinibacter sp. TaxID=2065818 RepID=UPI0021E7AF63|nr:hypothetical protein [Salinibacter sp.]
MHGRSIVTARPISCLRRRGGRRTQRHQRPQRRAAHRPNRPHLKGDEQTHVVAVDAADVTIEGFRISGSGTDLGDNHAGVMVRAPRATIRDNRLSDVLHGIDVKGKDQAVVVENVIEGPPCVVRAH